MKEKGIIYYAVAYNAGDPSVGIWEDHIFLGDTDKTGKNILCDLNMYADDEWIDITEELRDKLKSAMEICMDTPTIYFDFEWERG